ncbi:hypothetical protein IE077_000739 [Cardiosporidium cionae]|uniref:Uncharacterized protein n=1 Tax=Cardiosporidium cionae TaxID=476202 RepID=A0ABQ7JE11_9APIC|nr:hypothetical protein IE077_000739 [Cardiosporidium cionae]|eukprot:KAF8822238.1 hypothetical protein IE077_000739 [Cardiosporidium cionae]
MRYVDVTDHIIPIRSTKPGIKKEKKEEESGDFNVTDLLNELRGRGEEKRKLDQDRQLFDLPDYEIEYTTSSEDDTLGDSGKFRHLASGDLLLETDIDDPLSHPIKIEGKSNVTNSGTYMDRIHILDTLYNFYNLELEFISLSINDSELFSVLPSCRGTTFQIPEFAIGKYVLVKAQRRIENQLFNTQYEDVPGGVFDPHIGGVQKVQYIAQHKFQNVLSTAVTGPVLVSDALAFTILRALSRGIFRFAVKINIKTSVSIPASATVNFQTFSFNLLPTEEYYSLGENILGSVFKEYSKQAGGRNALLLENFNQNPIPLSEIEFAADLKKDAILAKICK